MGLIVTDNIERDLRVYIINTFMNTPSHLPFVCALSGGSLPSILGDALSNCDLDWRRWHVFYADERLVDLTDKDSNHYSAKTHFLSKVGIPSDQVYTIDPHLISNPQECAKDYALKISSLFIDRPVEFDLILLGLGPDGHTCSLFPNHPLLFNKNELLIDSITDSPKLPLCRITFTFKLINQAKISLFVACGNGKGEIMRDIFDSGRVFPATMVKSKVVDWMVDEQAASLMKSNGE